MTRRGNGTPDGGPPLVVHVLGSGLTGAAAQAKIVRTLAHTIDGADYRICAWFLDGPGPLVATLAEAGIEVRVISFTGAGDMRGAVRFARALWRERPAIVHLHVGGRSRMLVIRLLSSARVIAHVHGEHGEDGRLLPLRDLTRGADAVIATSKTAAERLGTAAVVVHPGVELPPAPLPRPPEAPPVLGAVARIEPSKGLDRLLDVVAELAGRHPGLRLEIAGDGRRMAELQARVDQLGIGDAIRFLGWCDDVSAVHPNWDVFVVTSRIESFGLAVLEAMASGLPVAGYRVGGLAELVEDGRTGLLADDGDQDGLVDMLDRLLGDPELRTRLGAAGRRRVEDEFSAATFGARIAAVYERVLRP